MIEKLLRSCPGLGKIFILIRRKREKSLTDRLNTLKSDVVYTKLLSENPNAFEKVVPIEGDASKLALGISPTDRELLKNVSIIVHASASVRFDDPLSEAIFTNLRSTREIIDLALTLPKLVAFVHVSTAYSNVDYKVIEEKVYPPHGDWKKAINIAETMDSEVFTIFTPHFTDFLPNTYLYTKQLAEQICKDYSDQLPIVIFRPSIVTGAEYEPIMGWIDNFNGIG